MDFDWQGIEREKGKYTFEEYDKLLEGVDTRGLHALFILDYSNKLYEEAQSVRTRAGREAFARFAAAAASRYRGRGVRWEIWNEPNLDQFWKPQPSAPDYAQLVIEAARAIRAADPGSIILAPASSGFPWRFLEQIFEQGVLEHIDEVSVHPYRNVSPETVREDYARLRDLIAKHAPGGKKLPVLSGEWGYSSWHYGGQPISLELQGKYLARQFLTNLSETVPISIWYDWANDGPDPKETEHNFGTVTMDRKPKPAFLAAKTLTSSIAGLRFLQRFWTAPTDHVLLFGAEGRWKLVAWTEADPHPVMIEGPSWGEKTTITAFNGETSTLPSRDEALEVALDGGPRYVDLPQGPDRVVLHGLVALPGEEKLRLAIFRHGPGKKNAVVEARIGEALRRKEVFLEAKEEITVDVGAKWPTEHPIAVSLVLRDSGNGRLLVKALQRGYAAVSLSGLSSLLDGDQKVEGDAKISVVKSSDASKVPIRSSLSLQYRFGKGWKFARVVPRTKREIPGKPSLLSLWVKGDGSGNTLRLRFQDSTGETFQPTAGGLNWKGWKNVTIPLDGASSKPWGGNANGKIDYPIFWDTLFLLDSTREGSTGSIELAGPVLVYSAE